VVDSVNDFPFFFVAASGLGLGILFSFIFFKRKYFLTFVFLWPPCLADADIILLPCGFYLLSIFFYSSPNLIGHRLDAYHTSTHDVALVQI